MLTSDPDLHPKPQKITATSGRFTRAIVVKPHQVGRRFTVPLAAAGGVCQVTYSIPTAVPALVINSPDTRRLGIRFERFAYHRPSS